ncbi:hypothetical protein [Citrobacter braakii]|uniref:hypothetical protein n=1 Tax=Citrobacter braakii TaxID=57706 RepID=UPI00351D3D52
MSFQFGIVAPVGILEKYRDLFESNDIFYTQLMPVDQPTHVILEDSQNIYMDADGWKNQITSLVGDILREESMTFTNISKNKVQIYKP